MQEVYEAIEEGLPEGAPRPAPGELPERTMEIEASGLFDVVAVEQVDWTVTYDAEAYIRLLGTFFDHIAMGPERRERLFAEIRRRTEMRPDGKIHRGWGAVLHVARRRDRSLSTCR
jgi:hypothetical protein